NPASLASLPARDAITQPPACRAPSLVLSQIRRGEAAGRGAAPPGGRSPTRPGDGASGARARTPPLSALTLQPPNVPALPFPCSQIRRGEAAGRGGSAPGGHSPTRPGDGANGARARPPPSQPSHRSPRRPAPLLPLFPNIPGGGL